MNIMVLIILVLPIVILSFDLRIMPPGPSFLVSRLYVLLLVPYVIMSRLLCIGLFSRLHDGLSVQIRGEQVSTYLVHGTAVARET